MGTAWIGSANRRAGSDSITNRPTRRVRFGGVVGAIGRTEKQPSNASKSRAAPAVAKRCRFTRWPSTRIVRLSRDSLGRRWLTGGPSTSRR